MDTFFVTFGNLPLPIQRIICQGTHYIVFSIVHSHHPLDQEEVENVVGREVTPGNTSSLDSWHTFIQSWVKYFSLPRAILVDIGFAFAHNFARGAELHGIMVHTTNRMSRRENSLPKDISVR